MTTVATTTDEKPTKRVSALVPNVDWLAYPSTLYDQPCRIVAVHPYGTEPSPSAMVVFEEPSGHLTVQHHGADDDVVVATAEEVADARRAGKRGVFLDGVHRFAEWLEERPWAPVPYSVPAMVHLHGQDGVDQVRQIADKLGVKVEERLDDRTTVRVEVGPVEYAVIAWLENGRPDPTGLAYSRTDGDDECEGQDAPVPADVEAIAVGSRTETAKVAAK